MVIPEPPNFTACIAHLAATTPNRRKARKRPRQPNSRKQCEQQYKALQTEVLGFLISSQWVINEAGSLGVKVSDKEVKKEFEKIKNTQFQKASEFEKFLQTSGQTVSDLLLRVKLNLLSQKIQKKIISEKHNVTQADVEKYYHENKSRFGTPEKRAVRIILTKTEAEANAAKKEIESGKSFASVAKAKSIDPTSKANGGLLPEVVQGEEEKALDSAIFTAKVNVLGGPVKTPFGYYIYEVVSIKTGSQKPLSEAEGDDQTAAPIHRPAAGAEQVRQRIQKTVAVENRMPRGLRGGGLQDLQSPEDTGDRDAAPAPARQPPPNRPPAERADRPQQGRVR